MLIKEYRIPLPLTLEEYSIAQLYMIQVQRLPCSRHQLYRAQVYSLLVALRAVESRGILLQATLKSCRELL